MYTRITYMYLTNPLDSLATWMFKAPSWVLRAVGFRAVHLFNMVPRKGPRFREPSDEATDQSGPEAPLSKPWH